MADLTRVDVDSSPDPVSWLEVARQPHVEAALWGLYYAIYYGDADQFKTLPDSVVRAYARVQEVARG